MDFWQNLAFSTILFVIANRKEVAKFYPVLAKVYVKVRWLSDNDPRLADEIAKQEAKESLK